MLPHVARRGQPPAGRAAERAYGAGGLWLSSTRPVGYSVFEQMDAGSREENASIHAAERGRHRLPSLKISTEKNF
jgi:hypothetical protein